MKIAKIDPAPGKGVLNAILSSDRIDIVSPFVSGWSLSRIKPDRHESVRLITRLPDKFHAPVAYLDNDPRPIKDTLERMGNRIQIFAMPTVHAKLYLNDKSAWTGSGNFTRNGFSGKQEILVRCDEKGPWQTIFRDYKADCQKVRLADIEKLVRWCELGLSKTRQKAPDDGASPDQSVQIAASYDDFVEWLGKAGGPKPAIRQHLYGRAHGVANMSGHIYTAFNGVLAFLRKYPQHRKTLKSLSDKNIPPNVLADVRSFIEKYGDEYKGVRGGSWKSYLATSLGGNHENGGAGNTIVKKCLVLLPDYMLKRGLS